MKKIIALFVLSTLFFSCSKQKENTKPNIVVIYVDDLGYADVGCYGAVGVETPNIDRLADDGIRFTDAHCGAATCTPSRYTLLTGSYAFRNNAAILPGDAPLLIRPGTPTIASMLKKNGYKTAVVGKWHLGLGDGNLNWNEDIKPGPREIGFDYSFLIPATGDRVPTAYVENHRIVGLEPDDSLFVSYEENFDDLPTGVTHPEMLKQLADTQHSCAITNGISRIGYQTGGEKAMWVDEDFPNILTEKAKNFITKNKDNPFFLYLAFHDIHVPRVPNPKFAGTSDMGPRGDAIAQMDWCTGEIVSKLEELGLAENTLIIFSSDNGPVLNDGYEDEAIELLGDHNPSGSFRGGKYSIYEAGTRVPTIAYWPGKIEAKESAAMWSQVDLYSSIANLIRYKLEENEAPDSFNMLETIMGNSNKSRNILLEEAFTYAVRKDNWKYIEPIEGTPPSWIMDDKNIEGGVQNYIQLYNLSEDMSEQNNLSDKHPEIVEELKAELDKIKNKHRTR